MLKKYLKKIKVVDVENKLQLIKKINGRDAFGLINRHKHILEIKIMSRHGRRAQNTPPF